MTSNTLPEGSVTSPLGFAAGAASAGLKTDAKPDVAVLVSENPCSGAGVFTQNRVRAAPVLYDEALLLERPGRLRGVVMNSMIANACTGPEGVAAAEAMAATAEDSLSLPNRCMLVLSTGLIGPQLPLDRIEPGIRTAASNVHDQGGMDVASALMTTDRKVKHVAVEVAATAGTVTVGGVAKGSGMVHPNMATVLAVLTTDAVVDAAQLGPLLRRTADRSFNAITVDGDTSPNDSLIMLANGASEVAITRDAEAWKRFEEAVEWVARELALMIVRDGEGATRFVELTIAGAGTDAMARTIGRAIARSALVKTALAGGVPNWGRFLAAAGNSGFPVEADRLALRAQRRAADGGPDGDWLLLAEHGAAADPDPDEATRIFGSEELALRIDLGMGGAEATVWTCDLTDDYVRLNAQPTDAAETS